MKQSRFFVDPILNEVIFDQDHLWIFELVETIEFQRLGRIHQLGSVFSIFPSASHTRLSHSLGVYELIKRFILNLNLNKLYPKECDHLMCAALLHDLGHGPLSHAFESYTGLNHEEYTKLIICDESSQVNQILTKHNIDPKEVVNILFKKTKYVWATQLIDSQIDADRMDYLMRDSRNTGAAYGQINPLIIIRGSKFIDGKICFRKKLLCEIENLLIGRFHMYAQVYNNAKGVAKDFVIQSIFRRIKDLYKSKYRFVDKYSLLKMFKPYLESRRFTVKEILSLDDSIFFTFLESIQFEKDLILKKLYKAYHNESLVEIKEVDTVPKINVSKDKSYFYGLMKIKPINIYHKNQDPIYIYDEETNKVHELTKVSHIINKLADFKVNQNFIVQINA